jgi:hypothetical protein
MYRARRARCKDSLVVRPAVLQDISHADEDCLAHINPASGRVRDSAIAAHVDNSRSGPAACPAQARRAL